MPECAWVNKSGGHEHRMARLRCGVFNTRLNVLRLQERIVRQHLRFRLAGRRAGPARPLRASGSGGCRGRPPAAVRCRARLGVKIVIVLYGELRIVLTATPSELVFTTHSRLPSPAVATRIMGRVINDVDGALCNSWKTASSTSVTLVRGMLDSNETICVEGLSI